MKRATTIALGLGMAGIVLLHLGCARQPAPEQAANEQPREVSPARVRGSVHSIKPPEIQPQLPAAPALDTVLVNCGVCHTPQYIMNQPPFPRETWTAEVTKMRKTFNGPIPEEKVPEIIDYLMSVRGAPSPTTAK
jgi:hypothetical protein